MERKGIFCGWVYICCLGIVQSYIQLNSRGQITNTHIGSVVNEPHLFNFSYDPIPFLQINLQNLPKSLTAKKDTLRIYDYIFVNQKSWLSPYSLGNSDVLSLGWYSQFHDGVTCIGERVLPFIRPRMLLGNGVPAEYQDAAITTSTVYTDPEGTNKFITLRLRILSPYIYLPKNEKMLDRSFAECYTFTAFSDIPICTLDMTSGRIFILQQHQENFVEFGLANGVIPLAITHTVKTGMQIYGAYDEKIVYDRLNVLLLCILIGCCVLWILVVVDLDSETFHGYIFSFCCVVVATVAVIMYRQLLFGQLHERLMYTTNFSFAVYGPFLLVHLAGTAMTVLYLGRKWAQERILFRFSVETLLATGIEAILVGRTIMSEELVSSLLVALGWLWLAAYRATQKPWSRSKLLIVATVILLYAVVIFAFVEPFVREIPELELYSLLFSNIFLFFPIVFIALLTTTP